MASDLSNIIKSDISSTLESLLSVSADITTTQQATSDDFKTDQCICVSTSFEFSAFQTVKWKFYIPVLASTKFEFLMLGGFGDLKDSIDDETTDATNEIISNICGSIVTNINAQGFADLGTSKFTINSAEVVSCDAGQSLDNLFKFGLKLESEEFNFFIEFDSDTIPYISFIATGKESDIAVEESSAANQNIDMQNTPSQNGILSLIGEESVENLKLLFDIKFKLSIRLGIKVLLLKDILNWDTGTIIELEQMVNEPLDILANGIKIGEGEAVVVEGRFGVKIKSIGLNQIDY